jgi:hypothetical protein
MTHFVLYGTRQQSVWLPVRRSLKKIQIGTRHSARRCTFHHDAGVCLCLCLCVCLVRPYMNILVTYLHDNTKYKNNVNTKILPKQERIGRLENGIFQLSVEQRRKNSLLLFRKLLYITERRVSFDFHLVLLDTVDSKCMYTFTITTSRDFSLV